MGWEPVNIDADKGIIEATDTTAWFGFKDDVVVRITDSENERLVDIRSKSWIGGSDLGKNAARIHGFIDALDDELANWVFFACYGLFKVKYQLMLRFVSNEMLL